MLTVIGAFSESDISVLISILRLFNTSEEL